ncbi:MAG: hypothetical protein AAFV43_14175 [Planctomycetota bacterium]
MGYSIALYLIDVTELERQVGSGDRDFLAEVIANNPDELEEEDDELSLRSALEQLILGGERDPDEAHQYGYALLEICEFLGESAPIGDGGRTRWSIVEASGIAGLFDQSGPPLPLPPSDDFPTIGHLRHGELGETAGRLENFANAAPPSDDELLSEEAEDLRDDFLAAAERGKEQGSSLVFFFY